MISILWQTVGRITKKSWELRGLTIISWTGCFMRKDTSQNFIVDALRHEGPTGSHKEGCPAVIKDFYGNGD